MACSTFVSLLLLASLTAAQTGSSLLACSVAPNCTGITTTLTATTTSTQFTTLAPLTSTSTEYVTNVGNTTQISNATSYVTESDSTTNTLSFTDSVTSSATTTTYTTDTVTVTAPSSTTTVTTTSTCTPTRGVEKRTEEAACVLRTSVRTIWPSISPLPRAGNGTKPANTTYAVPSNCSCAEYATTTSTVTESSTVTADVVRGGNEFGELLY